MRAAERRTLIVGNSLSWFDVPRGRILDLDDAVDAAGGVRVVGGRREPLGLIAFEDAGARLYPIAPTSTTMTTPAPITAQGARTPRALRLGVIAESSSVGLGRGFCCCSYCSSIKYYAP